MANEDVLYLGIVRRLMVKHFDLEELETLAFDLGIPWGELPGDRPSTKSRSLITCLAERGRIDELTEILAEERPLVDWPEIPDSRQQVQDIEYLAPASPEEQTKSAGRRDRPSILGEYDFSSRKSRLLSGPVRGAGSGFIAGVAFALLSWIVAGILTDAITYHTGAWPDWFPELPRHIVDFILSRWWIIIIIASFTVVGAIVGSLGRRRLELL